MTNASPRPHGLEPARWLSIKRAFQLVTLVFAVIAAAAALTLPLYGTTSVSAGDDDEIVSTATLLEVNGPGALIPVLLPVAIAAMPLFAPATSRAFSAGAAALLVVFVVVAGFSIGLFYLPAAVVAVITALLPASQRRHPTAATPQVE